MQKKTYTPDYLTHKKKYNHGETELIKMENHHQPIISRELWDAAQGLLRQKNVHNRLSAGHSNRYIFSGRIQCGECGSGFVSRKSTERTEAVTKNGAVGKPSERGQSALEPWAVM